MGFLPAAAVAWYLAHGRVTIAEDNDDAAGYLLGRAELACLPGVRPITQAAVRYDAQGIEHGRRLVARAAADAAADGCDLLQCWCAADLPANRFWSAVGFVAVAVRRPRNYRGRDLILWRRVVSPAGSDRLLHLPDRAGHRASAFDRGRLLTAADRRLLLPSPGHGRE